MDPLILSFIQIFPHLKLCKTNATKNIATVATASAQNDNGSLEAESIVRAASTRVWSVFPDTPFSSRCTPWSGKFDVSMPSLSEISISGLVQDFRASDRTDKKTNSSQQGLEFLFSPLLEEYYNPAHGHAEDNNNDQALNASFQEDEFINPFCTRVRETGESSSRNIDNTDVQSFQPQSHDYRWTRDHPLEQVRGNPTMPVQTR
ncbi:hypothetical protein Tco_1361564 [Tanacetum coccineum]